MLRMWAVLLPVAQSPTAALCAAVADRDWHCASATRSGGHTARPARPRQISASDARVVVRCNSVSEKVRPGACTGGRAMKEVGQHKYAPGQPGAIRGSSVRPNGRVRARPNIKTDTNERTPKLKRTQTDAPQNQNGRKRTHPKVKTAANGRAPASKRTPIRCTVPARHCLLR